LVYDISLVQGGGDRDDYAYQGVPATLSGPTNFKMTNAAPKEMHMMAIAKPTAAGEAQDVDDPRPAREEAGQVHRGRGARP
jgi:hypothetical protein